jgi:hypothetical protein
MLETEAFDLSAEYIVLVCTNMGQGISFCMYVHAAASVVLWAMCMLPYAVIGAAGMSNLGDVGVYCRIATKSAANLLA